MKIQTESPAADRIVAEKWAMWRESFRMAHLLLKEQQPLSWEDRESKEHYFSYAPSLAAALQEQMMSGSCFIAQAPEKDQIERYGYAAAMVKSMQAANEQVEKQIAERGRE
jgi:hypothetical protein